VKWDPEAVKNSHGHISSCKLDESAMNLVAVSSKEDKLKIINLASNEVLHEV
jgi:hypothetical protein